MQFSKSVLASVLASVAFCGVYLGGSLDTLANSVNHSCPRYEQCRCDTYGWCGPLPSGEVLQPVMRNDV